MPVTSSLNNEWRSPTGGDTLSVAGAGIFDEDGPDDLNGIGVIEQIRKHVPGEGTHRLSEPRRVYRRLISLSPASSFDPI